MVLDVEQFSFLSPLTKNIQVIKNELLKSISAKEHVDER